MIVRVYLRRDAQRVAKQRQAWIRAAQIQRIQGPADPSCLVQLFDSRQRPLGWGLYSPDSDIRVRLLSWEPADLSDDWLERALRTSLHRRSKLGLEAREADTQNTGYREVNSEGDGLPGLTVDRYGEHRVLALTTAPMAALQDRILAAFADLDPATPLVLRPEAAAKREGFTAGFDGPQLERMDYLEGGVPFTVPGPPTQKTGGYHDQRDNRMQVAELAAQTGGRLLDLGSHVGGFSVHAAARGVDALAVDSSETMLRFVQRNAEGHPGSVQTLKADMFAPLAAPELAGPFSTIVFDPPKIASKPSDKARASGVTTRVLKQLFERIDAGGHLVVCSCSHHFTREDMDSCVRKASEATGRSASLLESRGPGADHPVAPGHRQGEYLRVNIYGVD